MKCRLRTISPVHIGSGDEISPMDYMVNDNFIRININSLFSDPDFEQIREQFISTAGSYRYIGEIVPEELLLKHPLYSIAIRGRAKEYIKTNQTVVKAHIKSKGMVYIPGSSLKGSILSAMMWYVLKDAVKGERQEIIKNIDRNWYNDLLNLALSKMVKSRKGINYKQMRFMRWIDVTDSDLKQCTDTLEISLVRVKGSKSEQELPILYETIKNNVIFDIQISTKNLKFDESKILDICDQFYQRVLKKDGSKNISSGESLLRLGQGSSAISTSLIILAEDLAFPDYRVKIPSTKKRIDDLFAMGWVELTK